MARPILPAPSLTDNDVARFFSLIDKTPGFGPNGDCWKWIPAPANKGYGNFYFCRKHFKAHRISFFIANGKLPIDRFVCHSCDNPRCVNPAHLWLGTVVDNARDMTNKGRNFDGQIDPKRRPRGESHWKSKLTNKQIILIRSLRKQGVKMKDLASQFGMSNHMIYLITSRKNWSHVP